MILVGVDPGGSGGIAVLEEGERARAMGFPDSERDVWELVASIAGDHTKEMRAVIEKVGSRPGQGVKSMFTFGKNTGFIRACLVAAEIPFEEVASQKWQKDVGCPRNTKVDYAQHKRNLAEHAKRLYPGVEVRKETADALLLAEWLRRRENGGKE